MFFCLYRGRQYQEILEPLLPRLPRSDIRSWQYCFRWGDGGLSIWAPFGPAAPSALHTPLPHPCQPPRFTSCPFCHRGTVTFHTKYSTQGPSWALAPFSSLNLLHHRSLAPTCTHTLKCLDWAMGTVHFSGCGVLLPRNKSWCWQCKRYSPVSPFQSESWLRKHGMTWAVWVMVCVYAEETLERGGSLKAESTLTNNCGWLW